MFYVARLARKFLVLCALLTLSAGVVEAETLRDALRKAYYGNPTIRAGHQGEHAVKEQVTQARARWRPTVTANASKSLQWSDNNVSKHVISTPLNFSLQLSKPLYDGNRNKQQIKQARANVGASRQQQLATVQDVLFRTVQAYMNVIRDRRILNLRQQNVSFLASQLSATEKRFQVGEVTRTDVAQSRARLSGARSAVAGGKAQLEASIANYTNLVGHQPGQLALAPPARIPSSLASALATAQSINPNILAAAFVQDSAQHGVGILEADKKPQVNFSASASMTLLPQKNVDYSHSVQTQTSLTIPLYNGGLTDSQIRAAKFTASQRRIDKIGAVRAVREGVTTAWHSYHSSIQAITAAKAQVSASELALSGVQTEYQVGSRTLIDVLNIQQELVNGRIQLATAERDRIVASYQLMASIGRLTGRGLGF